MPTFSAARRGQSSDHWRGLTTSSPDVLIPPRVRVNDAEIDLCRKPYLAVPGQDITTALQTAINALAATGFGGTVYFSRPGTYLINGAQQTGTAFGNSYSAQVLFPGQPLGGSPTLPISIKGCGPALTQGGDAAPVNNVILLSNATSGDVFGVIPGGIGGAGQFSNICAIFEDINVELNVADPQCNILDMAWANKFYAERCNFQNVGGNWTVTPYTGTGAALIMPKISNSGFQTVRDCVAQGMPVGFKLGEHGNFEGYTTSRFDMSAFQGSGAGVQNWISNANVAACQTLLSAPNASSGSTLIGQFHLESANQQDGQLLVNDPLNGLNGRIVVKIGAGYSANGVLPSIGGLNLDVALLPSSTQPTWRMGTDTARGRELGWMAQHPSDNFMRASVETLAAAIPGSTCPTGHPYLVQQGAFARVQPPASAPAQPVPTTSATGGTIPDGVYTLAVSYVNGAAETIASRQATITTAGGNLSTITIPSPSALTGATGWYAYVSQAGSPQVYRQQAVGSPTAIGTGLTLTANPTTTGLAPGSGFGALSSTSGASTAQAFLPLLNGGESRRLSADIITWSGAYNFFLYAHHIVGGSNTAKNVSVQVNGGNVKLTVAGSNVVTVTGVVAASTPYTVGLSLTYNGAGLPTRARVYLGGVKIVDYRISDAQRALLVPYNDLPSASWMYDGFGFGSDTGTQLTSLRIRGATDDVDTNPTATVASVTQTGGGTAPVDANNQLTEISVNDATAFTLGNPSNAPTVGLTAEIVVIVLNNSGGAMGAMTIGTGAAGSYNLGGLTWAAPASTKRKTIRAVWSPVLSRWLWTSLSADY